MVFISLSLTSKSTNCKYSIYFAGKPIDENYIAKLFGVKKGETITKQRVARLKKSQLRKLGMPMLGLFTSNSYDYEYYKISPKDIAKLVAVLVKRDGALKKDVFVEWYSSKLYGTKLYGDALFKKLAGDTAQEEVPKDEIVKNFADAVSRWAFWFNCRSRKGVILEVGMGDRE